MHPSLFFTAAYSVVFLSAASVLAQDAAKSAPENTPLQQTIAETKPYIDRMAICLDIKDNEPDAVDSVFPPEVKRLYCFTAVKGAVGINEIQHRWYYNDDLQSSISLKIGSSSWRTYSAKSIPAVYTGEWMVAIVNSKNEEVIKTCKFYIK